MARSYLGRGLHLSWQSASLFWYHQELTWSSTHLAQYVLQFGCHWQLAGYKVQWGRVQKQYSCSTPALMHAVLPYAVVVQTMISPLVDPRGLLQFQWTPEAVFWIVLSGVAAFLVNLSGFLVMGHAGALTHVLLGQLKTSVICLGAYYVFDAHYTAVQLCGAAGAIASIVAYTHATTSEKARRAELGAVGTSANEKATSMLPLLDKKCSDI